LSEQISSRRESDGTGVDDSSYERPEIEERQRLDQADNLTGGDGVIPKNMDSTVLDSPSNVSSDNTGRSTNEERKKYPI